MKTVNMKSMKYIMLSIPLILIAALLFLFIGTQRELTTLRTEHNKLIEVYEQKINELTSVNKNTSVSNNLSLSDFHIERFKKKGLSNPVQDIISDLMEHPELIPYEAKYGGKMHFNNNMTWILNEKWVYAYFEDGHFAGYLLLEYSITDEGNIEWKRIASMI